MTLRILLILIAGACTEVLLGFFTSAQEGFTCALGVVTLLHTMIGPGSSKKRTTSNAESVD